MKKLFLFSLIQLSAPLIAQQSYYNGAYKFSDSIFKYSSKYDGAAYLSDIGAYMEALKSMDQFAPDTYNVTDNQKKFFKTLHPINASDYILKRAKQEQIIIINEAHHQPYHRVFTKSLLQGLYDQGYRYFGAEALHEDDTLLNQRKFPLRNSGTYIKEPLYSELIRSAIKIGFSVFAYESSSLTSYTTPKERDILQAKNIEKILFRGP